MIKFTPQWVTESQLEDATEGNVYSIVLTAQNYASVTLAPNQAASVDIGQAATIVSAVKVNGVTQSFTAAGTSIYLGNLTVTSFVEIWTNSTITYAIIGGTLPKGLTATSSGPITGTPYGITDTNGESYSFVARASNGTTITDRTFTLIAYPVEQAAIWNDNGFPLPIMDSSVATEPYHPLGSVKRGDAFAYTIDVSQPDGDEISISVLSDPAVISGSTVFNGSLPPGLTVNGTSIEGVIQPNSPPGKYFFTLNVVSPIAPAPVFAMIEVLTAQVTTFKRPVKMQWVTPAGSLGSITETAYSTMSVKALDPNGGNVVYSILAGAGSLPGGLVLNAQTGDIEGQAAYVTSAQNFTFTIRATSDTIFADRSFSIEVLDHFSIDSIATVKLKFQSSDRTKITAGYSSVIPSDWIFRPEDPNFGLVSEPHIHVAKGILPDDKLASLKYRANVNSRIGEHKTVTVLNSSGIALYDVVYRTIIDPMDEDPRGTDVRTDGLVINYAQSKDDQEIHPMSIWNMRYDLFADYDEGHGDMLPDWMVAVAGQSGYITATVVAYLQPGKGADAVSLLTGNSSILADGYSVVFDRVLLSYFGTRRLNFDTSHPQILPYYVNSGQSSVFLGRWANFIEEAFAVPVSTASNGDLVPQSDKITSIDMSSFSISSTGTVTMAPASSTQMMYFSVTGNPNATPLANNAPIGTDLLVGPFITGIADLVISGSTTSLTGMLLLSDEGIIRRTAGFTALSEVIIQLNATTFDGDTTVFDYQGTEIGKYIKLVSDF